MHINGGWRGPMLLVDCLAKTGHTSSTPLMLSPNTWKMSWLVFLLAAVAPLALAQSIPFGSSNWTGGYWSYGNYQNTWQPGVVGGTASFAYDNFTWTEIHSLAAYTGASGFSTQITPNLQSGDSNPDAGFIGFSANWTYFGPSFGVGIMFDGSKAYFAEWGDHYLSAKTVILNSYTPGVALPLTIALLANGNVFVDLNGTQATYVPSTTFDSSSYYLIMGSRDSADGIAFTTVTAVPEQATWGAAAGMVCFGLAMLRRMRSTS